MPPSANSAAHALGKLPLHSRGLQFDTGAPLAEDYVFGNREWFDQHEVLIDHPDPMGDGIAGRAKAHRLPVDFHRSAVWPVESGQNAHQRRFASAIFPDQGVNFTPGRFEIDSVIGDHRPKAFADSAHGNCGMHRINTNAGFSTRRRFDASPSGCTHPPSSESPLRPPPQTSSCRAVPRRSSPDLRPRGHLQPGPRSVR